MDIENIKLSNNNQQNEIDKKCAPGIKYDTGSCIELNVLIEMANAYNINNNNKIKIYNTMETLNPKKYKIYLLNEISNRTSDKCDNQRCWSSQSFIKRMNNKMRTQLEKYTFRPSGPEGRFDWLSNVNINEVMEQYENKYKDFKYLGTVPMDFDEISQLGIKELDLNKLKRENKIKLGIIFNLDEHNKSGSHWVALYTDLNKCETYYFDSYGIEPEYRVRKFMRRIYRYNQENNINKIQIIADYNKIRHQYENSECGVYSMNFIIRMLRGESFKNICNSKIHDTKINKCRDIYFTN